MPTASQRLARARALESLVRDIARDEILPRYLKSARNRKADGSLFTEADLSLRLNDFHGDCLKALQAGDAPAARAAIEQDLQYFGNFLLNLLSLAPVKRSKH